MRPVLIDEIDTYNTGRPKTATPYETNDEAFAALRQRIRELFADPAHPDVNESYLRDCFDTTDLDAIDDDRLNEFLSDLWVCNEGTGGVWSNFSSADRCPISGEFPDERPWGNGDTTIYETAGKPSGQPVAGRNATAEEDSDEDEGDDD